MSYARKYLIYSINRMCNICFDSWLMMICDHDSNCQVWWTVTIFPNSGQKKQWSVRKMRTSMGTSSSSFRTNPDALLEKGKKESNARARLQQVLKHWHAEEFLVSRSIFYVVAVASDGTLSWRYSERIVWGLGVGHCTDPYSPVRILRTSSCRSWRDHFQI